jgi:hypothetical protein
MSRQGSPGLVAPMRALLCARQSRSMAAQLVAADSGYRAVSAGCTAPLVFMPTSAREPAQHGLGPRTRAAPWHLCACSPCMLGQSMAGQNAISGRGRRAGFGADCAEHSFAVRQVGLTRILVRHLGVAYGTECDQHHEDRGAVPAETTGSDSRTTVVDPCMLRGTDALIEETKWDEWGRARWWQPHERACG